MIDEAGAARSCCRGAAPREDWSRADRAIVAKMARVPVRAVSADDKRALQALDVG